MQMFDFMLAKSKENRVDTRVDLIESSKIKKLN